MNSSLTATSSLPELRGKKSKIAHLLNEGKSDKEIASALNTTVQYVWKIKSERNSQLKKREINEGKQSSDHENSETNLNKTTVAGQDASQLPSEVRRLEKEDLQTIYKAFLKGQKPANIIAEKGFPKELVDAEYQYFRKSAYPNFDIEKFQQRIVENVEEGDMEEDIHNIIIISRDRLLTEDELFKLVEVMTNDREHDAGFDEGKAFALQAIKNRRETPEGWDWIRCHICGKPLSGAVVDPQSSMGKEIIEHCRDWCHGDCIEKQSKEKQENPN